MERQQTINLLNETFGQEFEVGRFLQFVRELLNGFEVKEKTSEVWGEYQDYIESYHNYGSYIDSNQKVMDILTVKLKKTGSVDRARTMQRNFIAKYLGNYHKDAALVAFYDDEPEDWRFSFVKMEYNLADSGKVIPELTPAKRYSFLVGVNEPNHTCRKQFLALVEDDIRNPTLQELESAFGIEKVTKEFFERYKELFLKLNDSLLKVISNDKYVQKEFEEKSISVTDFSKKLLGQIVFIYFLQKKGWLGVNKDEHGRFRAWGTGPKNFMRKLFNKEIVHYNNFFNDILEPLFYEALATPRDDDYYSRFKCKVPFLNGGLFEPLNDYDWTGTQIILDNDVFSEILSTFNEFNFTVKEDEPLEKEVAVDPEMLGKVFENLLEVKDRKSKGAFYTPREIVHYMCQQSLINYLETNSIVNRDDIEKFIQMGDLTLAQSIREQEQVKKYGKAYENQFSIPLSIKQNYKLIDQLLQEIKIVDPAVGSGAFPVGMMNEIVKARSILSVFFNKDRNIYELKRETIENSLYGVDIESSAVEITKLRFWLSLIVDELDMKNIKPLPNLDHKIMCGNSLLEEFEGKKLFDEKLLGEVKKDYAKELSEIGGRIKKLYESDDKENFEKELEKLERERRKIETEAKKDKVSSQATLGDSLSKRIKESQRKLKELKELQCKFFNEQNRKLKKQLRDEIDKLEWGLIEETLKEEGNAEAIFKLSEYKKNKSKPFFLWKLYFAEVFQRENPGFDVVIANPPYVRQEEIKEYKEHLRKYKVFNAMADLYTYFYELGLCILRERGVLTYISSNKFTRARYGVSLRSYLKDNTNITEIIDFGDKHMFDAITNTLVIIIQKEQKENNKFNQKDNIGTEATIINQEELRDDAWTLHSGEILNLKRKIEQKGTTLKEWDLNIYRGVTTGYNDAFVIDDKTRKNLIEANPNNTKIIKKLIKGRDIFRWTYKKRDNWIIFTERGININNYPEILKHLQKYREKLEPKPSDWKPKKDEEWIGRKSGPYEWYEIQDNTVYSNHFLKEKIVWIELSNKNRFALDEEHNFTLAGSFIMTGSNLKYLLSVLNSKICYFYFSLICNSSGMATIQWKKFVIERLPIVNLETNAQKPFIYLVDQILSITKDDDYLDNPDKQAKVKRLEKEIDQLVYKLYELTPEEIKIVEGFGEK